MIPSKRLIDRLLINGSAEAAYSNLVDMGFETKLTRLHVRLSQLIAAGKRKPIPQKDRVMPESFTTDIRKGASLEGCERLLAAQIALYRREAKKRGTTPEDVMLAMHYTPRQVEAWRMAA